MKQPDIEASSGHRCRTDPQDWSFSRRVLTREHSMVSVWLVLPQEHWLAGLVLAMLFLESAGEDVLLDPDWGFDSYEIAIPKELMSFRKMQQGEVSPLSYLLQLEGKNHIVRLWPKKSLLSRHLPVFSFTNEGQLLEDNPYVPSDCNYMGLVEGFQDSEATLSTCAGGLRGILNVDFRYYQIEPLKSSSSFEHVIYHLKKEPFSNQSCGLSDENDDWLTDQQEIEMARIKDFHLSYKHQRYLELIMVFDVFRFIYVKKNMSQILNEAILLTSIIDTSYQGISVRIQLSAIEIWSDGNRIVVEFKELSAVLAQFIHYRKAAINPRIFTDWAHLYVTKKYIDALAWSWGRVCEVFHAGSISSFLDMNVLGPATWTAHEVGHSLGMRHDTEYCQCRGRKNCIMGSGRTGFSNCSYEYYFRFLHLDAECLASSSEITFVIRRCGNKIVEKNEECDCGSLEECKKDPCCEPGCKLKKAINCSTGLCCHECNFLPSGYMCRQEENECDLAEYCNGTSGFCPEDTYKHDGTLCEYEGLCFNKICRSRHMQCQSIFGPDAREGPQLCYDAVNVIGDQFGNCEIEGMSSYKGCALENTICGRLQCINVKTVPNMPDHTILIATYLREYNLMCWGTGYHLGMKPLGIPDSGRISNGTSCGENLVCFNSTCMDIAVLKFDCLSKKCNRRGICNNKDNCHCMYGWAPPFCEEAGFGGSSDSGPPGPMTEESHTSFHVVFLLLLRLLLFVISVLVVIFRQVIVNIVKPRKSKSPSPNDDTKPTE